MTAERVALEPTEPEEKVNGRGKAEEEVGAGALQPPGALSREQYYYRELNYNTRK